MILATSCSRDILKQGVLTPDFDRTRTYRIAILPFLIHGDITDPHTKIREQGYNHLQFILQKTGKFYLIDKFTIEKATRIQEFGSLGKIDPTLARTIGKEVGADLVFLTELSYTPTTKGLSLIANVQMLDINENYIIYNGQGEILGTNANKAIDLATEVLINELKK